MCVFLCILYLSASQQCFLHCVTLWLVSLLLLFISHSSQLSLFYFIRYIIGNLFVVVLSVYVCVFLCLFASWQGFLHHVTLWLVSLLVCSFLTHDSSLLGFFIRFIIGNFFVVVLSVYVCVYLHLSGIFLRLSASCHIVTCFFVDVVDFSLMTTLFVLFHQVHYWRHPTILCDCIGCWCVCLLASSHCVFVRISVPCGITTCFLAVVLSHSCYSSNLWHVIWLKWKVLTDILQLVFSIN